MRHSADFDLPERGMPRTRHRRSAKGNKRLVVEEDDVNDWVAAVGGEADAALDIKLPLRFQPERHNWVPR